MSGEICLSQATKSLSGNYPGSTGSLITVILALYYTLPVTPLSTIETYTRMTDSRTTGDNEIFEGFLTLLKSNETTKVPRETTLGAISHFISTLPLDEVQVLLKAISESPRLWTSLKDRTASREAVQLGVSGAIGRLASQPGSSRWWHRKSSESAWLEEIAKTILEGEGMGKIQIMVAVLAVTSPDVQGKKPMWIGVQRAEMEDEVVMELARMMESTSCEKLDTEVLCVALDVIDGSKIRILDTKVSSELELYMYIDELQLIWLGHLCAPHSDATPDSDSFRRERRSFIV